MADPTHLTEPAAYDIEIVADDERWSGLVTVHPPRLVGWISSGPGQERLDGAGRFHLDRSWSGSAKRFIGVPSIRAWLKFEGVTVIMIFDSFGQRSARIAREHKKVSASVKAPELCDHMRDVVRKAAHDLPTWDKQCQPSKTAGLEAETRRARALWERARLRLILCEGEHDEAARRDARDGAALLRASAYSPDADTTAAGDRLAGHLADLKYAKEANVVRAALNR